MLLYFIRFKNIVHLYYILFIFFDKNTYDYFHITGSNSNHYYENFSKTGKLHIVYDSER